VLSVVDPIAARDLRLRRFALRMREAPAGSDASAVVDLLRADAYDEGHAHGREAIMSELRSIARGEATTADDGLGAIVAELRGGIRARPGSKAARCALSLRRLLADGPRVGAEVRAALLAEGFSTRTIERARAHDRILAERGPGALWTLPDPVVANARRNRAPSVRCNGQPGVSGPT
jgi:hypothetical protein